MNKESANHLKVVVVQKKFSQITSQVRNTYSYGSLHVIFTKSSYMYSTSANLRTTPSLQQLFSQGGAESQRGDHGLQRYFLLCQFYIFNSYAPNFLELINSSQLRKIRIPIVSDTECDRYSGFNLKVTTFAAFPLNTIKSYLHQECVSLQLPSSAKHIHTFR